MKKTWFICTIGALCIGLSGCGGKSDEAIVKDVQAKIEKLNWQIEHKPDAGTVNDSLKLIVNDTTVKEIGLDLSKDIKDVDNISSNMNANWIEVINYDTKKEKNNIYLSIDGSTRCAFNLIDQKVDDSITNSATCKDEAPDKAEKLITARDQLLKKADINLKELYIWAKWYHKTND